MVEKYGHYFIGTHFLLKAWTCINCYAKLSQKKPAHEIALSPFKTCFVRLQHLLWLSSYFGLRLYMCASSEGSGETVSMSFAGLPISQLLAQHTQSILVFI